MLDSTTLALIALIMVLGGVVKGTIGLGLPLVCVGFMSIMLPVKMVLGISIVPILLTNLVQVYETGADMQVFRRWWPMLVCFWIGLFAGSHLVVTLEPETLYAIIGGILVIFCASGMFKPDATLPPRMIVPTSLIAGSAAGLSGGLASVWGPPVSMFMLATGMKKEEFVRTIGVVWCAGAIPLSVLYASNGVIGSHNVYYSLMACAPALIGLWVGQRIRKRIPQDMFKRVLLVALLLIGLNLIRRAFFV